MIPKSKVYWLFLFFITAIILANCTFFEKTITIKFDEVKSLNTDSPVRLDSLKIGEVYSIDKKNDSVFVKVKIFSKYTNKVKQNSKFYLFTLNDHTFIKCRIIDSESTIIENGAIVRGYSETHYWIDVGADKIKNTIKEGIKKVKDFLKSNQIDSTIVDTST